MFIMNSDRQVGNYTEKGGMAWCSGILAQVGMGLEEICILRCFEGGGGGCIFLN